MVYQMLSVQQGVELAKKYTLAGGPYTNMVFPEAAPEEWLNCDQCTDCFKPAFNYRPKQSAQYALAISNFDSGMRALKDITLDL